MRAVLPASMRPSDIIRLRGSRSGKRVVVYARDVHSDSVAVSYRGIVGKDARRISDNVEGVTYLNRRLLQPLEGIWEGELIPGAPGRIVPYVNGRYVPAKQSSNGERKGAKMPAAKSKGRKTAAKKSTSNGGERATEAQLDKLSARVVTMRDSQGKAWGDICDALDIQPSRARQLYNRGGGEPTRTKAAGAKKGAAAKKTAAKGRGKRKNPS